MGDASSDNPQGASAKSSRPFQPPLPGSQEKWDESPLGPADNWPICLKDYSRVISSLSHPAAIYWGDELVVLYNDNWGSATPEPNVQGQPQQDSLSQAALDALRACFRGEAPTQLDARDLLKSPEQSSKPYYVLLNSLWDAERVKAKGVMAQLLLQPIAGAPSANFDAAKKFPPKPRSDSAAQPKGRKKCVLDEDSDNVPLDGHPFFHKFAEMLPTGLAILNRQAEAVFVNQYFYELTTHLGDDRSFKAWPQSIHQDDYDRVMKAYQEAFDSQVQLRIEFRGLGPHNPWRLLLLTPLGDDNLQHVSLRQHGGFLCSIVDITSEKSAELAQRKAAKEAQDRKEQQERFIDMISHEIRNPLSAVLHCAEDIIDGVNQGNKDDINVSDIVEAAETIILCVTHQKNIVDDVLSFSKLDASMLSLCPRSVQPIDQLARTLKMFQPELKKQNMEFDYLVDHSYEECDINYVMADLVRIGQVLINLISNAIKFTAKKKGEKKILVSIGASEKRPTSYPPSVVFFDADDQGYRMDATVTSEWGNGEVLYLMVAVKDTGIGISDDGQKRLFERFRQATPKTEQIYGGSGLGLNISRKLCHLHGGEIGVSSKDGEGSTFGFFFKVRRSARPERTVSPTDTALEDEQRMGQIRALGNSSPDQAEPDDDDGSLKHPIPGCFKEVSPGESRDDRLEHTEDIASEVQKEHRDEDSTEGPPSADQKHPSQKSDMKKQAGQSESDEGKGRQSRGLEDRRKEETKSDSAHGSDSEATKRMHILLVEDNIINQRILCRKLESKGFKVTPANNGRDAVEATEKSVSEPSDKKSKFDCILMDQEMPIMDGNAAASAIRNLERDGKVEHVPILGVTANVRGEQREEMLKAGMDDVIHKPYKIEDIVGKIKSLVKKVKD